MSNSFSRLASTCSWAVGVLKFVGEMLTQGSGISFITFQNFQALLQVGLLAVAYRAVRGPYSRDFTHMIREVCRKRWGIILHACGKK